MLSFFLSIHFVLEHQNKIMVREGLCRGWASHLWFEQEIWGMICDFEKTELELRRREVKI